MGEPGTDGRSQSRRECVNAMTVQLLATWSTVVPIAAVLLAVLYVPGSILLLLLRCRATVAIAGGPLLTALMLGLMGVLLRSIGVAFSPVVVVVATVLAWLVAAVLRWIVFSRDDAGGADHGPRFRATPRHGHPAAATAAAVFVAVGALLLPMMLVIDPHMPSPRVDPMYHYNVLNAIEETGTLSMFAAVDFNYGLRVGHVTYPTVWHGVAALAMPWFGIVSSANTLAFVVTPIVFAVNIALLARSVFRRASVAALVGAVAACMFPAFPGGLVIVRAFWPNALALAMLPAALVLLIVFFRRARWAYIRRNPVVFAVDLALVAAALCGLGMTHPSVLFNAGFIALPLLISSARRAHRVLRRSLSRRAYVMILSATAFATALIFTVMLIPPRVRSYLMRPGNQTWDDLGLKVTSLLANWPTDVSRPTGLVAALVVIPLVMLGLILLARSRNRRWIFGAWCLQAGLVAGSYVPLPVLSGLSGLWYSDTYRLLAVQAVVLPLAVGAVAERFFVPGARVSLYGRELGNRTFRLVAVGAAASMIASTFGTAYITLGVARPVGALESSPQPVADEQEMAFIRRIGERLPEGTVVIGDPASGVAYLPLESDVESVFTQVNMRDVDRDGAFLAENFDRIRTDPRVCILLRYYGIQYFYEDASMNYNYIERHQATPGFYDVDTSKGFHLVAREGDAALWRIDGCGPIQRPQDWWDREHRKQPLFDYIEFINWLPGPVPSRE